MSTARVHGGLAAVASLATLAVFTPSAWADTEILLPPAHEIAVSTRSEPQILHHQVQLAGERLAPAVLLLAGETVYLKLHFSGSRVTALSVLPEAERGRADLVLTLFRTGRSTALSVHGPGPSALRYGVASPGVVEADAVLREHGAVPAFGSVLHRFESALPSVLVFGLEHARDPRDPRARAIKRTGPPTTYFAASLTGAAYRNTLGPLNRELRANGHEPVSNVQPIFGLELYAALERVYVSFQFEELGERTFRRVSDGEELALGQIVVQLQGGYVFHKGEQLSFFGLAGIAAGDLNLEVRYDEPALFADQLADETGRGEELRRNRYAMTLTLGGDYRLPVFGEQQGLTIGLRAGYLQQIGQEQWARGDADDTPLRGGPDVDVSGPFVRVGLGVYAEL